MEFAFGWKPPRQEVLDAAPKFRCAAHVRANLPAKVDLSGNMPGAWDQSSLGSCTAHAIIALIVFDQTAQGLPVIMPSRLYDYYNSRLLEGTTSQDAGASIADAVGAIVQYGFCPETEWPYDISQFAVSPPSKCYTDAAPNKVTDTLNVEQVLDELKGALASGRPFAGGLVVYPSFMKPNAQGMVPVPSLTEQMGRPLGGHALSFFGYDDSLQAFWTRGSWGPGFALNGYHWTPYQYLLSQSLASDFHVLRSIPGGSTPMPPTPQPGPSPAPGGIQAALDALFGQAIALLSGHPVAQAWMILLQKQLDAMLSGGLSFSAPQIKALADLALGAAAMILATTNPGAAAVITAIKQIVDSILAPKLGTFGAVSDLSAGQIQQFLDSALGAVATVFSGNPTAVQVIGYVQTALDAILAVKKAA